MRNNVLKYIGIWKWIIMSVVGNLDLLQLINICKLSLCLCMFDFFSQ
jgi:hypothetical protein